MGHLDDAVHRRPDREQLRELVAELVPGGRLASVHALKGGISQGMHRLEVTAPGGERRRFVLRRFNDWTIEHDPAVASREWRVLEELERLVHQRLAWWPLAADWVNRWLACAYRAEFPAPPRKH
jgi:hypothetical protein